VIIVLEYVNPVLAKIQGLFLFSDILDGLAYNIILKQYSKDLAVDFIYYDY